MSLGWLDEHESGRLLSAHGVPVVAGLLAVDPAEAAAAAATLGFPVVLKVCSPALPHKSDAGGVVLGLPSATAVEEAARILLQRFGPLSPRLLVGRQVAPGVEILAGTRRDPVFGPVVLAGLGGLFAETLQDVVLDLAPVDEAGARALLLRLKGAALLRGARGRPPVDLDALARALAALSRVLPACPEVQEAEVNPLVAGPDGCVAVDALVRVGRSAPPPAAPRPDPASLAPYFDPSGVALVGASATPGKGGHVILQNLLRAGCRAPIHPVNPRGGRILDLPVTSEVRDLPDGVDLAMVVIPRPAVPAAVDDLLARGIRAIILSTAGYGDVGDREAERELVARVRAGGARLMGPNSIGTLCPAAGIATSIVTLDPLPPGGVALVGQTGVLSAGWARMIADRRPFGVSRVACIGNKADVDEADLLAFLARDPATRVIGLYLEGVADGPRFLEASREASRQKPVVVLKGGRSPAGAAAMASHTGSLATEDRVFDAVCRRAGLLRVPDVDAFFDALAALERQPLPRGNRLGALSISGMGCVLSSDAADLAGVTIPDLLPATRVRLAAVIPAWAPVRNPVDVWSAVEQHGAPRTLAHVAACLLDQDDVDGLLLVHVLMPESTLDAEATFGALRRDHPDKPFLVAFLGGDDAEVRHLSAGFASLGVPCYPTPERAVRAFGALVQARDRGGR